MSSQPQDHLDFTNDFPIRAGLLILGVIGVLSFIAACTLLIVAARSKDVQHPLEPVDKLFRCLIVADAVQALSGMLIGYWAFEGQVIEGPYCNAQAAIRQLGDISVALCTLSVAVLTFAQVYQPLWISQRHSLVSNSIIGGILLFLALVVCIPASAIPGYYGNTGLWCWVSGTTPAGPILRIVTEYAWYWLTAAVSILVYGYVFFKWINPSSDPKMDPIDVDVDAPKNAMRMIWFPLAYFVEIFPGSVIRFLSFYRATNGPHRGWTIFGSCLFTSSGLVNALLWLFTGRRFGFARAKNISA